jgi:hypothetical protein
MLHDLTTLVFSGAREPKHTRLLAGIRKGLRWLIV